MPPNGAHSSSGSIRTVLGALSFLGLALVLLAILWHSLDMHSGILQRDPQGPSHPIGLMGHAAARMTEGWRNAGRQQTPFGRSQPVTREQDLREKPRKIAEISEGANIAAEKIKRTVEMSFRLPDHWSRRLLPAI